eukprot:3275677-Pyramimonas_sp.AAC.1
MLLQTPCARRRPTGVSWPRAGSVLARLSTCSRCSTLASFSSRMVRARSAAAWALLSFTWARCTNARCLSRLKPGPELM